MSENFVKISEGDCKKVLAKYFNNNHPPKITDFSLTPISDEVNGFMSENFLLKINVTNGPANKLRFFVKAPLVQQEAIVEFAKSGNMFNKEVFCYKFLEDVKKEFSDFDIGFAPKYYFSREDEVIILEDLTESRYKIRDGPLELDLEHLKLSLESTARFHAASFIFEEMKSKKLGRKYELTEDYGEWLRESLYYNREEFLGFQYIRSGVKGLCALTDVFPKRSLTSSEFQAKLWVLTAQAFEDVKPSKRFRNVWCNGDLWTKNFMFRYEDGAPVACKIFDFQLQRYNPPAHDVVFMIYQTADREMRQKYFDDLLDHYYDSLKSELEKTGFKIENILSRDEFDLSIKAVFPTIKLTKAIYKSLSAISKESFNEIFSSPEVYADITFRDRSEFVVKEFGKGETYRDVMTTLLEDLEDLLTHEKITIEDCYKILRQKLGTSEYELLEYKIIPFDERNFKLRIEIRQQANGMKDLNFFVKDFSREQFQKPHEASPKPASREMKFYSKFIPELLAENVTLITECVLNCLLARLDDLMVFDDFSDSKTVGFESPYGYETAAIVIKKLAKFHAACLIFEEKTSNAGTKFNYEELCGTPCKENEASITETVLAYIGSYSDQNSKVMQEYFEKHIISALSRTPEFKKPSAKYRNTICHGALWPNNILIQFEDESPVDCVFVNFHSFMYNPPAVDLISFLYLSTDRKFRSQYMHKILDLYHSEISKNFKSHGINVENVLCYKQFLESCKNVKEYGVIRSVVHFHNILTSEEIELTNKYKSPFISKICSKNAVCQEKIRECIIELKEIFENSHVLDQNI